MANFKVGGKVVCLESGTIYVSNTCESFEYKKGETYTVTDLRECACGVITLCFGQVKKNNGRPHQIECACGIKRTDGADLVYINSKYFLPVEEQEYKQVTYTKILDEIPVCAQ